MTKNIEKNLKSYNWGYIISMGILFLVIGLVISIQTRSFAEKESVKQVPTRQLEQMVALLKESEEKEKNLVVQVSQLRKQIDELRKSEDVGLQKEQLEKIYMMAGLTEIKGKGITVILDDRKSSKLPTPDNDGLVHGDDILKIVNELKSASATAISVNNQRLVTTSEIIEASNSIMINQTRLVAPYVINAVGDPQALKVALSFRGSIVEYLRFYGISVNIQPQEELITIPPYTGKV